MQVMVIITKIVMQIWIHGKREGENKKEKEKKKKKQATQYFAHPTKKVKKVQG